MYIRDTRARAFDSSQFISLRGGIVFSMEEVFLIFIRGDFPALDRGTLGVPVVQQGHAATKTFMDKYTNPVAASRVKFLGVSRSVSEAVQGDKKFTLSRVAATRSQLIWISHEVIFPNWERGVKTISSRNSYSSLALTCSP